MTPIASSDTIAAIATPPGRGGIGIVRVSGPKVTVICDAVIGHVPAPRLATFSQYKDSNLETIDQGITLYFPQPHSFTGEDVLELHGHGGPVVLDSLLERVLALGARLANPGEFSLRSFCNGKIDLAQAEAISDIINSATKTAARSAVRTLQGTFSEQIHQLVRQITEIRALVEASIDFSDQDNNYAVQDKVALSLGRSKEVLTEILKKTKSGQILRDGISVAIVGQPNVGKSTLLNRLLNDDRAIVTDVPGTTRDVLHGCFILDGMPVNIFDTAGLRETVDPIEQQGIEKATDVMDNADFILLVKEAGCGLSNAIEHNFLQNGRDNLTVIYNKIDTVNVNPRIEKSMPVEIYLSAKKGVGMELLTQHLRELSGFIPAGEGNFVANRRHIKALSEADKRLDISIKEWASTASEELCAENLRLAQQALGTVTGEFTTEDLLSEIFSSFCIGK